MQKGTRWLDCHKRSGYSSFAANGHMEAMDFSLNGGNSKSFIVILCSIINQAFWGDPGKKKTCFCCSTGPTGAPHLDVEVQLPAHRIQAPVNRRSFTVSCVNGIVNRQIVAYVASVLMRLQAMFKLHHPQQSRHSRPPSTSKPHCHKRCLWARPVTRLYKPW